MINLATLTIKLQGNAFDNGSTQYICAARCSLISSVMKWSYLGAVPASVALHFAAIYTTTFRPQP